jgi:hypothetical protein
MALGRCKGCREFVTANARSCPNCGAGTRSIARAIAAVGTVAAAGAVAVTLMACYGCPDCMYNQTYCPGSGTYVYDDAACPTDAGSDRDLPDVSVGDASIDSSVLDASDDASDGDLDAADSDTPDADGG